MEQARLIKHQSYTRAGIVLSSLVLVAFIYGLLCPPVVTNSYADSNTDAVVTEAGVNVGSMISIALDPSIDIDVMPSSSTVYDKKAAKLTVTTNNSSGYSLYMQTLDDTANLTSDDLSNTTTIAPLAKASILEQFETNTWGYNLGRSGSIDKDRIYYPVPTTSTTVMETGGTSYRDEYDLTFGVAVSNNLPVGRYSNSVMISAVANPTVITSLNQAQYMQTMNKELCQNTDFGVTKQLIDIRDGKKYWVARLLDGNCWMTQNLALTLKDFGDGNGIHAMTENGDMGSKLTSDNTDLPLKAVNGTTQSTAWDESSEYPPTETRNKPGGSTLATSVVSFNFGKYVLATPTAGTACANQAAETDNPLGKCASAGFVDVSNNTKWHASDVTVSWVGEWDGKEQRLGVELSDTENILGGGVYDAHFLTGNWYSWNAATAGSGAELVSTRAQSSICPKNWKLPASEKGNATSADYDLDGTAAYLFKHYGFITSTAAGSVDGTINGTTYNVATEPIYLARAGKIAGSLVAAGREGFYTIDTAGPNGSDVGNYGLNATQLFSIAIANINLNYKYIARNVRCVIY